MRILEAGDSALLLEFDSLPEVLGFMAAAEAARPDGVADLVPGARTVLVCVGGLSVSGAAEWARSLARTGGPARGGPGPAIEAPMPGVEIPVRYDGPDLGAVAELTGLSVDEVVAAHTGTDWVCGFGGFAPGFGYLAGGDPRLRVPRRATPRVSVPAGSVGLAGEFSGVYPRPSPGGWQLVGRTDLQLWDLRRDPPALLRPGTVVRFVAL